MTYVTTATTPELTVVETGRTAAKAGDNVGVRIEPGNVHLFDRQSEKAI
jgi:multiple sugar transport system ATP-binding protein